MWFCDDVQFSEDSSKQLHKHRYRAVHSKSAERRSMWANFSGGKSAADYFSINRAKCRIKGFLFRLNLGSIAFRNSNYHILRAFVLIWPASFITRPRCKRVSESFERGLFVITAELGVVKKCSLFFGCN